jgi:hypothetical protein
MKASRAFDQSFSLEILRSPLFYTSTLRGPKDKGRASRIVYRIFALFCFTIRMVRNTGMKGSTGNAPISKANFRILFFVDEKYIQILSYRPDSETLRDSSASSSCRALRTAVKRSGKSCHNERDISRINSSLPQKG